MSLNKNNILFYFSLLFLATTFSQEKKDTIKSEKLDEVVITATRTLRQLSTLPLPAQLISQKDIERLNSLRLSDVLNEQTGLTTVPDFGGGEGIQLQGLDSQYTLVLIDGVPLIGRLAGTFDINRISVDNAKQIEIVKGPSSSLYGSEAIGGVVNIITDEPKLGFKGNINQRVSSLDIYDSNLSLSYKKNKLGINTYINRYSSGGYDIDQTSFGNTVDPFTNYTINTKLIYNASSSTKFFLSGRYYIQNQDNIPTENLSGESEVNEWSAHFKADHSFNTKWTGYLEFYSTRYKTKEFLNNLDGSRNSDSFYNQFLMRPELRITFEPNNNNNFIFGLGLTHETIKRTSFSTSPEFNSPYIYAQYDTKPLDKLNLIFGARFDSHNEYASRINPKLALRYELSDKIAFKGSVGFAYKTPAFRQLYFDFTNSTIGYTVLGYNVVQSVIPQLQEQGQIAVLFTPLSEFDNEIKPESSIGYNLGIDFKIDHQLKLGLNLFRNDLKNLIDTRVIASKTNGQNVFSYYNVNKSYTQGLELNASWKPNNYLKILGGYQLLFAKDKDAENAFKNGEVFARLTPNSPSFQLKESNYFGLFNRSRHMTNFKVFYSIPKWGIDANIRGTYRSKYGLFDTNANNYLDEFDEFIEGYTIWDFAINKTLFKKCKLSFGIDNAFNFTKTPSSSANGLSISNLPGRLIYGKLNIQI